MRKLRGFLLVLILCLIGYGVYVYIKQNHSVPIQLAKVEQGDITVYVEADGKVKTKKDVTVFAPDSGIVRNFNWKVGDSIQEGQVIATLDRSDAKSGLKMKEFDAQLELERTNLAKLQRGADTEKIDQLNQAIYQAKLNVEATDRERKRIEQLKQAGAVAESEYDRAKDEWMRAQSALQSARSELTLAQKGTKPEEFEAVQARMKQIELQKSELAAEYRSEVAVAPLSGKVIQYRAANGQYVPKGSELLTITSTKSLEVEADVKEDDMGKVRIGQDALVTGGVLGDAKVKAKVVRIEPIAHTTQNGQIEKTTVAVELQILHENSLLKPGYNVDVNFIYQQASKVLYAPYEAIQRTPDGSATVWVVQDGKVYKRKVETGIADDWTIQVKRGLKEGEQVVVYPPTELYEGVKVAGK